MAEALGALVAALLDGRDQAAGVQAQVLGELGQPLEERDRHAGGLQHLARERQPAAHQPAASHRFEQARGTLTLARPKWDALIVMPELRSIVFALLAEATGIRAAWPMLWHGTRGAMLVTSEALAEPGARLPLDAPVLVQSLAVTLHHAGMTAAAQRLHEACVRLRDNGVVTLSRGSPAPYVNTRSDAEFVSLICAGMGIGSRPVPQWRALGEGPGGGTSAAPMRLNLVASNSSLQRS